MVVLRLTNRVVSDSRDLMFEDDARITSLLARECPLAPCICWLLVTFPSSRGDDRLSAMFALP